MINWVGTNKEWVFSGVGIAVIGLIINFFRRSSKKVPIKKGYDLVLAEHPYSTYWVHHAKFSRKKYKEDKIPSIKSDADATLHILAEIQVILNSITDPDRKPINSQRQYELLTEAITVAGSKTLLHSISAAWATDAGEQIVRV